MDPAVAIEVAALSQQSTLNEVTARGNSDVQRFYENSVIFITGGSGFLGKHLIEKLFRSCRISKLFLLLRSKKGKTIQDRLADILTDPIYDTLRKMQPDFSNTIIAVEGDVAKINLGINNNDWKTLTREVNVIFHVAATTRFDETLKLATLINVRGTREALCLGKFCTNLRSFIHVSTAYTHTTTDSIGHTIREQFYDVVIPPETLISMAESMDADRLISITKELIKGWPNTYTFTKSISEDVIRKMSVGLPISIVRPSIVLSTYREPSPGWIDRSCIYGASGLLFGIGLGVLHTIRVKQDVKVGLISCDYVNNAIIAAGRETANNQAKGGIDTTIYTVTSTRNPITWRMIETIIRTKCVAISTPMAVYYCGAYTTANYWLFMIQSLFLHLIPAYIVDFVCLLMGKQRRFSKLAKKAYKMCSVLSYFMINEWNFTDDNLSKLYNNLSDDDKVIYNFDVPNIEWTEFILIQCIGIRKYILKDGLKNTDCAVKKQRYLKIANYLFMTLYLYVMWKLIYLVFYIINNSLKRS